MTLVRTTDENGDDVLECEKGSRGQYVWNPSPEVFAKYERRESMHATVNAVGFVLRRAMNGESPIHGSALVVKGEPGRGYLSYIKHSGGVPDEEHAHTRATMASALNRLRGRGP